MKPTFGSLTVKERFFFLAIQKLYHKAKCYNSGHSFVNSPEIGSYPLGMKINALVNAIFGKHRIWNNSATKYHFVVEPVMSHSVLSR